MGVGKTGFKMSGSGLKIRELDWSGLQMSGTGGKLVGAQFSITLSFASSLIKNIVVFSFSSLSKFPVKLICCFAFGSASSAFCLLKSIAITL